MSERPVRILYVEDDPWAVAQLPALLDPLPHVIADELCGTTAFEKLERGDYDPDIVLTDLLHPGLNGYQLSTHLKASQRLRALPIVLFSRNAHWTLVRRGIEHGADVAVPFPLAATDLPRLIVEVTVGGPRQPLVDRLRELDHGFFCSEAWRVRTFGGAGR